MWTPGSAPPAEVVLSGGDVLPVRSELGTGGQATVYAVADVLAAKLFDRQQKEALSSMQRVRVLMSRSAPSSSLVWPLREVVAPIPGYVMERVPDTFIPLHRLLRTDCIRRTSLRARVRAACELARLVRLVHEAGYTFCDLSDRNVQVNPETGEIRVIDCDSMAVDGVLPPLVKGTPRYLAPEVQDGRELPGFHADRHTLAVLIFQLLLFHHPLLGDAVHDDAALEHEALARRGLYVHHPEDHRNSYTFGRGGIPPEVLPGSLRQPLDCAFVRGLHHPARRVSARAWEQRLRRALDMLCPCPNPACWGRHIFVERPTARVTCCWCGTRVRDLMFLEILPPRAAHGVRHVRVQAGTPLQPWHAGVDEDDPAGPVAQVVTEDDGRASLRNIRGVGFEVRWENGRSAPFSERKRLPLDHTWVVRCGTEGWRWRLWRSQSSTP